MKNFAIYDDCGIWVKSISAESLTLAKKYIPEGYSLREYTDTHKQPTLDVKIFNKETGTFKILTITESEWFFLEKESGLFEYKGSCFVCENEKIYASVWLEDLIIYEDDFDTSGWY